MCSQANFSLSCEFFPTNTQLGAKKLLKTYGRLNELSPDFYSVTFGAGGASQQKSLQTVKSLIATGATVAPHISCLGLTQKVVQQLLLEYQRLGIRRLVVIRGDLPIGSASYKGDFVYASDLVAYIRQYFGKTFEIAVAAYPEYHPQSENAQNDLVYFKHKVDLGATSAITQYFFNSDAYFHFVDSCQSQGIDIPIIPGIMPITDFPRLLRFSRSCAAEIPLWIRRKMESYIDDKASSHAFGLDIVTQLCEKLLAARVPGLHFYTLNQVEPTEAVLRNLRLEQLLLKKYKYANR